MSQEDLILLKDEMFKKMRDLEKKIDIESNGQKEELNSFYQKIDQKIEHLLTNNREIIESVVSEKINYEKIHALENFKNKADGILISHEIRINNNNKDINNMKTKYDKVIVDNLSVPGLVGNSCQYKNIGEYIVSTISEFSRFKYEKDTLKVETKELKAKIDSNFKKMLNLVDNSIERCKDYANDKIVEYKKHFDVKFDDFTETAMDIRLENSKTRTDIEEKVNNLKAETEKLLSMNEKLNEIDKNIKNMNSLTDRFNYDINTLFEKNKSLNKLISNLKNEIVKTHKIIKDMKTRSKKAKESKEKDNNKDKSTNKNRNNTKDRKLDLLENKEENKNNRFKKRGTIHVHDDRSKLSDLYGSPKKPIYTSKSNKKNIIFENFVDKKRTKLDESIKKGKKYSSNIMTKNNSVANEIKEEKKNDCEISNDDDEDDSSMNKESDETDNEIDNLDNFNQDYICEHSNNIYYNGKTVKINSNINDNSKSNIKNDKNININNNKEMINNTVNNTVNNNIVNDVNDNNENIMDNSDTYNNKINKNIDINTNKDNKINLKKIIDNKLNKKENILKKEKKENTESKSITSNKDNNEIPILKNYEIKCDIDRNEILKKSVNLQNNNNSLYSNKTNNSGLNDLSHNNDFTNSINNKKSYKLDKIEEKKSIKKVTYNDKFIGKNIFPKINENKTTIFINDGNNNVNVNNIKYTEITDNNDSSNLDNEQNSKSISENTSKINSNINSNLTSNLTSNLNSNKTSKRNSLSKTNTNNDNKKKFSVSKTNKRKYNETALITDSKEKNYNFQTNPQISKNYLCPIIPPSDGRMGVNYVGLNIDNIKTQEDDDSDDFRLSLSGEKLKNLRLEGIGVSSPKSQKIERKKVRLQGISTEAPLKISAVFGRTAYTFINKTYEKNTKYNIKLIKRKKDFKKSNLDVFFAPNNK